MSIESEGTPGLDDPMAKADIAKFDSNKAELNKSKEYEPLSIAEGSILSVTIPSKSGYEFKAIMRDIPFIKIDRIRDGSFEYSSAIGAMDDKTGKIEMHPTGRRGSMPDRYLTSEYFKILKK